MVGVDPAMGKSQTSNKTCNKFVPPQTLLIKEFLVKNKQNIPTLPHPPCRNGEYFKTTENIQKI